MRSLQETSAALLVLRKPSWRSGIRELVAGEEVVGVLDVDAWRGGAEAEAADGCWRFDRPRGFAQRAMRILLPEDGSELAVVRRTRWGRGAELVLDGHRFVLAGRGMWRPSWAWTGDGTLMLDLMARATVGEVKGQVQFTPAGLASPHAMLLALLGAHLALLSAREQAGSSAGATAAATVVASS